MVFYIDVLGSIVEDKILTEEDKTLAVGIHSDLTLEKFEFLRQTLKPNSFLHSFRSHNVFSFDGGESDNRLEL